MRVDPAKQRIDLDPSELGNADLGVALTGSLDFSSDDPRLVLGIAGTRMSVAAMKLLWPICTAPKVRAWVEEHVLAGTVDRLDISTNAPWSTLKSSGPPVPDDGLLIQIVGTRRGSPPRRRPAGDSRRRRQSCAFPAARR